MKDIETSEGWRNQVKIILMRGGGVSSPSIALTITRRERGGRSNPDYIGISVNTAKCSWFTFLWGNNWITCFPFLRKVQADLNIDLFLSELL